MSSKEELDWTQIRKLTDVLLGRGAYGLKPIYTPTQIKPPKGFEKEAVEVEIDE